MVIGIIEDDTLLRKALDTSMQNKWERKKPVTRKQKSVDNNAAGEILCGIFNEKRRMQ